MFMPINILKKDTTKDLVDSSIGCPSCQKRYPSSLLKACIDHPFDYALKLVTGEIMCFTRASIHGEYVHLSMENHPIAQHPECLQHLPFVFDRGVDVRADAIVWCADAPQGS
jgi:hypothetical protein